MLQAFKLLDRASDALYLSKVVKLIGGYVKNAVGLKRTVDRIKKFRC